MVKTGNFLGGEMSQTRKAIWLWELILEHQPFKRIMEFGTWKGNLSLYFLMFCKARNAEFYTYDVKNRWKEMGSVEIKEMFEFPKHFYQLDIFRNIDEIGKIISQEGQTILFCDNGNKPREFNVFSKFLKVGDIIVVHDWGKEVFQENVKKPCEEYKLKEIFIKESEEENLTRVFQKYE